MTFSFQEMVNLFTAGLGGLISALVMSVLAIWIARRVGLVDVPGRAAHKKHAFPTPMAGGIALILSLIVLTLIFHLLDREIFPLAVAVLIIFLFGIWDDMKGLGAPLKFAGQILASIVLIASDVSVHFLEGLSIPFLSGNVLLVLDWLITIIWFVGITNAFNLIDSMDGIALGVAGIAFGFFMIMALISRQTSLALFSACLMGICIGMYVFNVSPARLFLGDSGAQTLGFILAGVAMIYTPHELPQASSWFVPILVLGVPIFDTTLVFTARLIHHKPLFQADFGHTYHRLVALGLGQNRAVFLMQVATLALGFLAFIGLSLPALQATLVFFAVILIGLLLLVFFWRKEPKSD